jgi:hypothetical protein
MIQISREFCEDTGQLLKTAATVIKSHPPTSAQLEAGGLTPGQYRTFLDILVSRANAFIKWGSRSADVPLVYEKPKRPAADNKPMSATRAFLNSLATDIDTMLNGEPLKPDRKIAFVLLTFPFRSIEDAAPRCNYVSNGVDRREMIVLFKELIARFEGQPEPKDPTTIQ